MVTTTPTKFHVKEGNKAGVVRLKSPLTRIPELEKAMPKVQTIISSCTNVAEITEENAYVSDTTPKQEF